MKFPFTMCLEKAGLRHSGRGWAGSTFGAIVCIVWLDDGDSGREILSGVDDEEDIEDCEVSFVFCSSSGVGWLLFNPPALEDITRRRALLWRGRD